ncbi:hypothetical protein TraAM80_08932 [Trypanosoma rangeli]|uniref:FHA domain-containing protein n=1 Tax=Trypanosoma rangeli TaxID=5698 RepID=A0A3R7KD72_TRYRA|nr:uncharacterized protein TraAM80_08932 [Trypanosoma rangeli]RNE98154.1 hypothetical protein TraAM80_08932 [Trypanosoma rangeli]|eukprot:RNE98154.1 hypothetical protein TraAM80_08932 [Trypanosoma rangeli]
MVNYFDAEMVLTKGPETLPRRMSLLVPTDGTPVTVGRAPENDIVLSAHLLFASQSHCQFFMRPVLATLSGGGEEEAEKERGEGNEKQGPGRKKKKAADRKRGRDAPLLELCLIDMGSSNGTFVNGKRVEANVVTPLRHRDVLVFGGMRDIAAGASLPADAVIHAPEIVTWCVALNADDIPIDCASTPPVVLHADFVEAEEKRITLELLQRMTSPPLTTGRRSTTTANQPPTVLKRWNEAPSRQLWEYEHDQTLQGPADREEIPRVNAGKNDGQINETANAKDDVNKCTQRGGHVAAALFPQEESMGAQITPS